MYYVTGYLYGTVLCTYVNGRWPLCDGDAVPDLCQTRRDLSLRQLSFSSYCRGAELIGFFSRAMDGTDGVTVSDRRVLLLDGIGLGWASENYRRMFRSSVIGRC